MKMDLDKIVAAGHVATAITIIGNSDEYTSVETVAQEKINPGMDLMKI